MRRHRWKIALCMCAFLGGYAAWYFWLKPFQDHFRWYDRVRADIHALASKRPPEISREEWEFVVCWTLQMHANCAWPGRVVRGEMEPFAAELEQQLTAPVSLATIDWIWDEYCRFTDWGLVYSNKFRPTHPANYRHAAGGGGCGIEVP